MLLIRVLFRPLRLARHPTQHLQARLEGDVRYDTALWEQGHQGFSSRGVVPAEQIMAQQEAQVADVQLRELGVLLVGDVEGNGAYKINVILLIIKSLFVIIKDAIFYNYTTNYLVRPW